MFVFTAILKSVAVFLWSFAFFKIFVLLVKTYSSKSSNSKLINSKLLPLFDNIGKIIIFVSASYMVMVSWGINPVGWLASAGVLGIVLGLAAKDTIANLFSGIFIMVDSPYKDGDYINLDSGERGYVKNIGIRSTRIMTRDDIEITIPNSVIANAKIINESGGPYENERVRLSVGVAYGSDVDQIKAILIDISKKSGLISEKFEPRVRFREFGESSLNFELLFWIDKPETHGRTIDSINTSIYKEFNRCNIEIPFPQRTIHLKNKKMALNKKEWFMIDSKPIYLTHGNFGGSFKCTFESKMHWQKQLESNPHHFINYQLYDEIVNSRNALSKFFWDVKVKI